MPSTIELRQTDRVVGSVADAVLCIDADELLNDIDSDLVDAIRKACTEHGFFYIDLSASQRDAVGKALLQMDRFFSIKDDDPRKQQTRQGDGNDGYGWVAKGTEPAYQPGTVSSLEAFDYGKGNLDDAGNDFWPPIADFRSDLSECWREYCALGNAVFQTLALAAELPRFWLAERCDSLSLNTMRLLHYAAESDMDANRNVGIAAHTDFECITLLYQTSAGLELLNTDGDWLDAPVREGRIVVLLGDMLERWTNGSFKASGHRVRNTPERRFSIVQFFAVNKDVEVAPLQQFVTVESPARYTPIKQERHIDDEIARAEKNAAQVESTA